MAWLVVPFGGLMANGVTNGITVAGLTVGVGGQLLCYWAIAVLIYRVLKAGDLIEDAEEEAADAAKAANK
jgi:hypothetical protein